MLSRTPTPAPSMILSLTLALALSAAACGTGENATSSSPTSSAVSSSAVSSSAVSSSETTSSSTTPDTASGSNPDGGSDRFGCVQVDLTSAGAVQRPELIEASGVVASHRHDGVLWAHNDSGAQAGVFAFDLQGRDLGFFELTGPDGPVAASDVEDIALLDGRIYLADIGDNLRRRSSIAVYVFDEPVSGSDGAAPLTSVIRATYPDGPRDAEALLIDPISGELLVMSKDLDDAAAPTGIYSLGHPISGTEAGGADSGADSGAGPGGEPIEMELVGQLDVAALTTRSSVFSINGLLFPGAVTGADISADGGLIAVRTYGTVWLFPRAAGQSPAQALASEPCEGRSASEAQGEAVGFLPESGDGLVRYVTVSEGSRPAVNVVSVEIKTGSR